jgi:hypothetical protein
MPPGSQSRDLDISGYRQCAAGMPVTETQDLAFNAFSISTLRTVSIFSGVTGPTIL